MRLFDRIAAIQEAEEGATPSSAEILGARIRAAPVRYVLDDTVAVATTEAAFAQSERLIDCFDLLRLPSPSLWVEWCDASRWRTMEELKLGRPPDSAPRPGRTGLFIQADDTGRRGSIDVAWTGEEGAIELSPVEILFDWDDPQFSESGFDLGGGDRAELNVRMPRAAPVAPLFGHVRFRFRPEWRAHFDTTGARAERRFEAAMRFIKGVACDVPMLLAFCLMLTAHNAVELAPSQLQRLNKSRARSNKPPLLDYVEVISCLDEGAGWRMTDVSPSARAAARLHFVCGHLVRRDSQIFWRRAHVRGSMVSGVIRGRNVRLSSRSAAGPRQKRLTA